jgi:hypothetical protein
MKAKQMSESPIRRGQLIVPFGSGSLYVGTDGVGMLAAGLDHWFKQETGQEADNIEEFSFHEWRLEKRLNVNHFRNPPDYRDNRVPGKKFIPLDPNSLLTIPYLRFPTWSFCPVCKVLKKVGLSQFGNFQCTSESCQSKKRKNDLIQVPIVTICENGHIDDFPWREWVHRSVNNKCMEEVTFFSTGNPGLDGQYLKCKCGKTRHLGSVLTGNPKKENEKRIIETYLTKNLDKNNLFTCKGKQMWNGTEDPTSCGLHLKGSLRSSNNIYYALHEKCITVPSSDINIPEKLLSRFKNDTALRETTKLILQYNDEKKWCQELRKNDLSYKFEEFHDDQIFNTVKKVFKEESEPELNIADNQTLNEFDLSEVSFKLPEYNFMIKSNNLEELRNKNIPIDNYHKVFHKYFKSISIVKKLIETKALYGFTRIDGNSNLKLKDHKDMMRKNSSDFKESWLPAIENSGEGIFIEFNYDKVIEFENRQSVIKRNKIFNSFSGRGENFSQYKATPRYMMLHTFSHILINALIFECGYGASSLQERIYCSDSPEQQMAGVLIYTAATDSEGTMGGLVRNGQPGNLEKIMVNALKTSEWCSADPVCYEIAENGGQGPSSLNMAACHNCALVPETSCDQSFNSYLDRILLRGTVIDRSLGYFDLEL